MEAGVPAALAGTAAVHALAVVLLAPVLLVVFCGAGRGHEPLWRPDAASEFEVGTQLRPWTIMDEGMDYILDNCQSMAAVNNIYLIVIMHQEHRPFQARKFPHNPARGSFEAEDSTVCFFPDMERYGTIKPTLSRHDWIRETDWLRLTVEACRSRGLGVGAEISHYPIPKSLLKRNPDWQQKDIHGKPVGNLFCPHHPDVRRHVLALFSDIAADYDVDYIQTCQWLFTAKDVDRGGTCFCGHCVEAAKRTGFDMEAAIPLLRANRDAQPERDRWLAFRRDATTAFYREIAEEIRRANPRCHLRLNDVYSWRGRDPSRRGLDIAAVGRHLGSLVNQDHQEQLGRADEDFSDRKKWLADNRRHLGPGKPLICGIAPRMRATPELVRRGIEVAVRHPARINGLALKHYDGASFSLLRAFKQGMIEAGVRGLAPTIGKEVEEMELEGYEPFREELAEERGVETTGTGRASYVFDRPSGVYDVRITYYDERDGRSRVRLLVAGAERASFRLDEDCDCWRWRMFKGLRVKRGDTVTLIGEADGGERARLDYIEFIPRPGGGTR
jgi:hypothetical protein